MGLGNFVTKEFQSWFDKNNNANFLFITAAIGWILASAAQTFGIIQNKEIPDEEKKFLVPQEIMDGTANIGMYALVTTRLMKGAEKLAKPSKGNKEPFIRLKDAKGNVLSYAKNRGEYAKMGRNLRTGAAILGGVVSTCILTPIVRNAFGAYVKKRVHIKNETMPEGQKKNPENYTPTRTQPYFTKTYNTYPVFKNNTGMRV